MRLDSELITEVVVVYCSLLSSLILWAAVFTLRLATLLDTIVFDWIFVPSVPGSNPHLVQALLCFTLTLVLIRCVILVAS